MEDPALTSVEDREGLGLAFRQLLKARGLSYARAERIARGLPARPGRVSALPTSTISEACTGRVVPTPETLAAFLDVCEVPASERPAWVAACERVRAGGFSAGLPRVRERRGRELGVHAAARHEADTELPAYVERDVDRRLRHLLREWSQGPGGFALLVGTSSTGKTRTAYEAILAILPDWWLLHPVGAGQLRQLAERPMPRTVVWLDEIQRYLADGLAAETLRALRHAARGVIVLGTLWPDRYNMYKKRDAPGRTTELYAREREVLDLADVIELGPYLSPTERRRAEAAGRRDRRITEALRADVGMAPALAAAPELLRRWLAAPDVYGRAVMSAAADARRIGAEVPLSRAFLEHATRGYLTPGQRAKAPAMWFARALEYALEEVHGGAAAFTPSGTEIGEAAGFTIADYLLQHALQARDEVVPPASVWEAFVEHLDDPVSLGRLGLAAHGRCLHPEAEALWAKAIAAGDIDAAFWHANRLWRQERIEEAAALFRRVIASEGVRYSTRRQAAVNLGDLLRLAGRIAEVEELLHEAIGWASDPDEFRLELMWLLQSVDRFDDVEILINQLEGRDFRYRRFVGEYWKDTGRLDEAEAVHRAAIDAGEVWDLFQLGYLLRDIRPDESEHWYRRAIKAGNSGARGWLALLIADHGRYEEAEQLCREAVELGDRNGYQMLAQVLQNAGRTGEAEEILRRQIDKGDFNASSDLAELLRKDDRANEADELENEGIHPPSYQTP